RARSLFSRDDAVDPPTTPWGPVWCPEADRRLMDGLGRCRLQSAATWRARAAPRLCAASGGRSDAPEISGGRSRHFSMRLPCRGDIVRPVMEQRPLGKSGLKVSQMGLGCMGMSEFYGPADEAESRATLEMAIDRGVTLLDTADFYGAGK